MPSLKGRGDSAGSEWVPAEDRHGDGSEGEPKGRSRGRETWLLFY